MNTLIISNNLCTAPGTNTPAYSLRDKKKSLSVPAVSRAAGRPPRQKGPRGLERATAGIFVFKVVNNGTSSSVSGFGWDGSP
jgi:hypothetical protein